MTTSEHFTAHVLELEARALAGDEFSIRSLCAMSLLAEGWRVGDPDPVDTPPDDGGEVVNLAAYRRAA
jgi:hypothetical protein